MSNELHTMDLDNPRPQSGPGKAPSYEVTHRIEAGVDTPENKAILVNKELLIAARNELKARLPDDHILPKNRDLLNRVVQEMGDHVVGVYSKVPRRELYKWFDSDVAKLVQSRDDIKDKGRFVDACLLAYVYGEEAVRIYCAGIKVARLPRLSDQEKDQIRSTAAAIAAIEGEELSVRPAPSLAKSEN